MKIVKTVSAIREEVRKIKAEGRSIGLVPTMGFLHEGHLSLIEAARAKHDVVMVSIFVNPLQFGPNEDFERYPRDLDRDERLARNSGVDILFCPGVEEMYPGETAMTIHVTKGIDVLCGASRPGHFDGVATVVMKLFQLTAPDEAFFGQKDAQQVAIITNMVETFNVPVGIVSCPTVREEDGLAKSSRNVYLTEEERQEAPFLYQALQKTAERAQAGERSREQLLQFLTRQLEGGSGTIDYVDVLTYPALEQQEKLAGRIIFAVAYHYTHARLIDNIIIELEGEEA
ncbi:pantoate--beta-alanine ligase [Halalkalibacter oceani]|uniref:pantoate--beta-alanine ligase n=1 Tax=Halalkalibacter oceani TaxID=1653776 RepID=UPI0033968C6F